MWSRTLPAAGTPWHNAKLVLFRDQYRSACGAASAASGPFYCPGDEKIYLDLAFYDELKSKFGAPGEFAQAYVLAHELGHHVQKLLGTEAKVHAAMERNPDQQNQLSVMLELQADCFAGVWAFHANQSRHILEGGDIESAMNAAAKIGDDALQRSSGAAVVPESFTHGTSAQRQRWFTLGITTGSVKSCDTFSAQKL